MIGEVNHEKFYWFIENDSVLVKDKKTDEMICEEELMEMVDYAFRHTTYPGGDR